MSVVYTNRYIRVELEPDAALIRYVRSAIPYVSMDELERSHEQLGVILDHLGRDRYGLLVDVRQVLGNQSPDFERVMGRARKLLYKGFPRIAAVVRTAAGMLQLQRHAREDGVEMYVFRDEETARLFLRPLDALESEPRDPGPKSAQGQPRSSRTAPASIPPRSTRTSPPSIPPRSTRASSPSIPPTSSRVPPPSIPPTSSRASQPSIPPRSTRMSPPSIPPQPPTISPASSPQPPSSRGRWRR